MSNNSIAVAPLGDRVIVLRDKAVALTEGGVIIPEQAQEKPLEGTVVAIGRSKTHQFTVSVGDRVMFAKYAGMEINPEGAEKSDLLVMREDELLCVRTV